MNLLAIETSTAACSVAVSCDGRIEARHVVEPRAHTGILLPMIRELVSDADLRSLDGIVLGNGPGSFIGMRIGAAVAQGLAFAAGLRLIPVSSLAAVAVPALAESSAPVVLVAQDARMQQVYLGRYRAGRTGLPAPDGSEEIVPAAAVPLPDGDWVAAGAAWTQVPALAKAVAERGIRIAGDPYPTAGALIRLAEEGGVAIDPALLEPAYLRSKVAEVPE